MVAHLASTIHCVDEEIIGWLRRREGLLNTRLSGVCRSIAGLTEEGLTKF